MLDVGTAILAMSGMSRREVRDYFLRLAGENGAEHLVAVVDRINQFSPTALRAKVEMEFLVKTTIDETRKFKKENPNRGDNCLQTMLKMSAILLRREIRSYYFSRIKTKTLAFYGLALFDLWQVGEDEKGLAQSLVRDCGRILDRENLNEVLGQINGLIMDKKKVEEARNLLAEGYIGYNGAYAALIALWHNPLLSQSDATTPDYEILENLKKVLKSVQVENKDSVEIARVLFYQACHFPGEEKARKAVLDVRPDLVVQFTDDSGKTFGKKAE